MEPFQFQKGNKNNGCEDAPPVAVSSYSIICDGLGGAGSTKYLVSEEGGTVNRTSAYLGSRIVSCATDSYFKENAELLGEYLSEQKSIDIFVQGLKEKITEALERELERLNIEPSKSRTLKVFPTTLASALYFPFGDRLKVLAVWAGDSRVYILSPSKGLQLFSVDDAEGPKGQMNSSSSMNNCISIHNDFRLNYALFEMAEPGVVFCCSDGCFDYMKSPLHFEWLLLNTILECMPEGGSSLGEVFAASVEEYMYESIGDDTTMAGICFCMESIAQMKSLYQGRMAAFGKDAEEMNDYIKQLRAMQSQRDEAKKMLRLLESQVKDAVRTQACRAFTRQTPEPLYDFMVKLPCCRDFFQKAREINENVKEKYGPEAEGAGGRTADLKEECIYLLRCDYVKAKYEAEGGLIPGIVKRPNRAYVGTLAAQVVETCVKMLERTDLGMVVPLSSGGERKPQISVLVEILRRMKNPDARMADFWEQSFCTTSMFEDEHRRLKGDAEFGRMVEEALHEPEKCRFASRLTKQRIQQYQAVAAQERNAARGRFEDIHKKRMEEFVREYYRQREEEILDALSGQLPGTLRQLFRDNPMAGQLNDWAQARRKLNGIGEDIQAAQKKIDSLWEEYRTDYELFNEVGMRGEV